MCHTSQVATSDDEPEPMVTPQSEELSTPAPDETPVEISAVPEVPKDEVQRMEEETAVTETADSVVVTAPGSDVAEMDVDPPLSMLLPAPVRFT